MIEQDIINIAASIHQKHWFSSGDESTGDKLSNKITQEWQTECLKKFGNRIKPKFSIADHLKETIELVDTENKTAFELRTSPNNPHHEFYKDIFKVLVARKYKLQNLNKFYFILPEKGANILLNNLGKEVIDFSKGNNLDVVIFPIVSNKS